MKSILTVTVDCVDFCRPRMGAWIEIASTDSSGNMTLSRPRMGAWIEIAFITNVAPGLNASLPHGGVD